MRACVRARQGRRGLCEANYERDIFIASFVGALLIPLLQITGETVGEVKAVADMHQRKAEMARQSDAFIALPG